MSRFVPHSSQEIISYAQEFGWTLETQKGDVGDFCYYPMFESVDTYDYSGSLKSPNEYDLLSKQHLFLLIGSNKQKSTPIWFYNMGDIPMPYSKLKGMFFDNQMDNINNNYSIKHFVFYAICDYVMGTDKLSALMGPYFKNRNRHLDTVANAIGFEAFANIERDVPKRSLNLILEKSE